MLRRIPAALSEVQATGEGYCVVDHNHLLVVRGACGMDIIHLEVQATMRAELVDRPPFSLKGIDHMVVPRQYIDVKPSLPCQKSMEEFADTGWKAIRLAIW